MGSDLMDSLGPEYHWISVEDQLPEDYKEVLYFAVNDSGTREIMTGHREHGGWTHCCLFYSTMMLNDLVKVTHWMYLPEYPDAEPKEDDDE